jgi:hypothetical protein
MIFSLSHLLRAMVLIAESDGSSAQNPAGENSLYALVSCLNAFLE